MRKYPAVVFVVLVAVAGIIATVTGNETAAQWIVSGGALVIAAAQFRGMVEDIRAGSYGIDILAVTAIVSTVAVGEYWAALVVCLMLTGGEALEDYAESRAGSELTALLDRAPTVAYTHGPGGDLIEIDVAEVQPGQRLVVRPHEIVPVDATLDSDTGIFDESSLTGESLPVERSRGDEILSGSLNGSEAVEVTARSSAADSQYQRIIALVREAQDSKAPFVRLADRVAVPFTLTAFIIAGAAWALSGDPMRFAQVLVVATPCPLIIAAPVAFLAGMSRSARAGIIVKNAGTLEQLAKVRTVAFDKTGTLTTGIPSVVGVVGIGQFSDDADHVLALAAAGERYSSHPLAEAIVAAASERAEIPTATDAKDIPAHGVRATVDGAEIRVGKRGFVAPERDDVEIPEAEAGHTLVWVSRNEAVIGYISIADGIRPETARTLAALSGMDVSTAMMTGDSAKTAHAVAGELGMTHVYGDLLPAGKVDTVGSLTDRPVLMVGDGVNDAPVLAAADVGAAMGARGSAAAVESADVVVMIDDLARVPRMILIGARTMRIAWQAIAIGVGMSVVLMLIGATGVMPAFVGAWMQELVDLACILWALLAARPSREERAYAESSQEVDVTSTSSPLPTRSSQAVR